MYGGFHTSCLAYQDTGLLLGPGDSRADRGHYLVHFTGTNRSRRQNIQARHLLISFEFLDVFDDGLSLRQSVCQPLSERWRQCTALATNLPSGEFGEVVMETTGLAREKGGGGCEEQRAQR